MINIGACIENVMPSSPVDQQITDVQNVSDHVKALISELEGKLKSVLTPGIALADIASGGSKEAAQRSPLAGKLSVIANSLGNSATELRTLINRIEI